MVWGWMKSYHRQNCTYNYKDLNGDSGVTKTLDERIPLTFMRKAFNHCMRFVHYYRMGLIGQELAFAVKKYKSHREISPEQRGLIKSEFEKYWKTKLEKKG
jgi:hypothetical protein